MRNSPFIFQYSLKVSHSLSRSYPSQSFICNCSQIRSFQSFVTMLLARATFSSLIFGAGTLAASSAAYTSSSNGMPTSVVYSTEDYTVTSCASSISNYPVRSTPTTFSVFPIASTCAVTTTITTTVTYTPTNPAQVMPTGTMGNMRIGSLGFYSNRRQADRQQTNIKLRPGFQMAATT